jgi:uncharacterized membrane protein
MSAESKVQCRVQSAEWGIKNKSPLFEQKRAKQKQKKDRRCIVQSGLFQVLNYFFNQVTGRIWSLH